MKMETYVNAYIHPSKELQLHYHRQPDYVVATYGNLKDIDAETYLQFLQKTGEALSVLQTGRLLADFTNIQNFSTALSAVAINNFRKLITDRTPYLLLAILTDKNLFTDPAIRLALEIAKPLSRKFVDGHIFKRREEAVEWLLDFPIKDLIGR